MNLLKNGQDEINADFDNKLMIARFEIPEILQNASDLFQQNVQIEEEKNQTVISYQLNKSDQLLPDVVSNLKTNVQRLRLALSLVNLVKQSVQTSTRVPFIHPQNIVIDQTIPAFIHQGTIGVVSPKKELTSEIILKQTKALLTFVLKNSTVLVFEQQATATQTTKTDEFLGLNSFEEIIENLGSQLKKADLLSRQSSRVITKRRYRTLLVTSLIGLISIISLVVYILFTQSTLKQQNAQLDASYAFISNDYAKTTSSLSSFSLNELDKNTRYQLAVSAVQLSDLTNNQKQTIINTLSVKSDDNTLNYWADTGRSNFKDALNLALNLNDDQLTLFAYNNLYTVTKLDTKLDGATKQSQLDDYTKKINDLKAKLGIS